jgi:hypothetical protein
MIADKKSEQKWYGNGNVTADQSSKANGGLATETQGREDHPDMYKNDVDDNIWKRGGLKRIRHREDE